MNIEIYGAKWCNSCGLATKLCESKNIDYKYFDIDDTSNLVLLESKLKTKVRNIPQIFVNDVHIKDGYTGLQQELSKI